MDILHNNRQNNCLTNGLNITIKAQVDSFFNQISHGYEGTVLIRSVNNQRLPVFTPLKVSLISPVRHEIGDVIQAHVTLRPIIGKLNYRAYDRETAAMISGIRGQIKIDQGFSWQVVSTNNLKQQLYERIE